MAGKGGAVGGQGGEPGSEDIEDVQDEGTTDDKAGAEGGAGAEPEDDETWFATLDPQLKSRIEKWHGQKVTGLRGALDKERTNSSKLEKDLRSAAAKAEKGSELQKQLEQAANDLEAERGKSTFFEEAHSNQVLPGYAKVLFPLAQDDEYRTRAGKIDWPALRNDYPLMFQEKKKASGQAGAGTQDTNTGGRKQDMNTLFRSQVKDKTSSR